MKAGKKRPVPPPPPMEVDGEGNHTIPEAPQMEDADMGVMRSSSMIELDTPEYVSAHKNAQELQHQVSREGFVLLKNAAVLPFSGSVRLNVFGAQAKRIFDPKRSERFEITINEELFQYYQRYRNPDAVYTGSGYDESACQYEPQHRTSGGMFGGGTYLRQEPYIGNSVWNGDGSVRVAEIPKRLLENATAFSDTAAVVLYREAGEGADHEKGDETLSEGEAAMLSFCSNSFKKVVVILATNSVIDGDFLVTDTVQRYYKYTYGGDVYSNNIGMEKLADMESRVELKYLDGKGRPSPHVYPIRASGLGACLYVCDSLGDRGGEALLELLTGREAPSGRLTDEMVFDYDDDPVSRCYGALVFSKASTGSEPYSYGHNYVAYKEGVYLGYRYFETFAPESVVYPFGFDLSYTTFDWSCGMLKTDANEYGELRFSVTVTVKNTGLMPGKEVVQLYVTAPYYENGKYGLEKPLVSLAAFEKTACLEPGKSEALTLRWNARDIACYSDVVQHYVLEDGEYRFSIAANAKAAHEAPAAVLRWRPDGGDVHFLADEVTGTPYRNLFTGSEKEGWTYDARGTQRESIVYIHRTDVDGVPTVAPGTYPEYPVMDEITRETKQILDLETRGLSSYYEMDGTDRYFGDEDLPVPTTNAVYTDGEGKRRNFSLQDVNRLIKKKDAPEYHSVSALKELTGVSLAGWTKAADDLVWNYYLDQLSVNEMLCRFYHCGFDIPALPEYGVPRTLSADGPGRIGANNKEKMGATTAYRDSMLACTFNAGLCYRFGLALGREAAASGENGTSWFYAPGSNIHRSCLSGKNNNYFSQDPWLSGIACGQFLKGLEEGGVNGCLKHFACNDQEMSREGLVVFSNEQALREIYLAAFEHAIKLGGGMGVMTSLGRVGTVNACGNGHLTNELLRKEWGFDGMVITDGYGVTSYMYGINCMLGAGSGLLCFGTSGDFGSCRDFMELYRFYLAYPGRTIEALRRFMRGSLNGLLHSHTFVDFYQAYDYLSSEDAALTTDVNWFEAEIGLGYEYRQAEKLTYKGIKLAPGESNPPGMMPNKNSHDRGGTIAADDYGLVPVRAAIQPGQVVSLPVSMAKCAAISSLGFSIQWDADALELVDVSTADSILDYRCDWEKTKTGCTVAFAAAGNLCPKPCGKLFDLQLKAKDKTGCFAVRLLPKTAGDGRPIPSFFDKQGHEMSLSLSAREKGGAAGSWSGAYQSVFNASWWDEMDREKNGEMAELTLLSGWVEIKQ